MWRIAVGTYATREMRRDESTIAGSLSMARSGEASLRQRARQDCTREAGTFDPGVSSRKAPLSRAHRVSQLVVTCESLPQVRPRVNPRTREICFSDILLVNNDNVRNRSR